MKNIFIVCGEQCGKSAAAFHLSQALNCDYAETGRLVIQELAKFYALGTGTWECKDRWAKLMELHKREFRPELVIFGDLITMASPTYLIDECAKRARIIVGVRRRREVLGYFAKYGPGSWSSIWIKITPKGAKNQYELADIPGDFEVINDGSPEDLQRKMQTIAQKIQSKA